MSFSSDLSSNLPTQSPRKQSQIRKKQHVFKVLLIGNAGVGKTSILRYIKGQDFSEDYLQTIGVEFNSHDLQMEDEKSMKLQIWDSCGDISFQTILRNFYKQSHAIFFVYDCTDIESFSNINIWYQEVQDYKGDHQKNQQYILIASKIDSQPQDIQVSKEQGQELAKKLNMKYFYETSSLKGTCIKNAFLDCSKYYYEKQKLRQEKKNKSLNKSQQLDSNISTQDEDLKSNQNNNNSKSQNITLNSTIQEDPKNEARISVSCYQCSNAKNVCSICNDKVCDVHRQMGKNPNGGLVIVCEGCFQKQQKQENIQNNNNNSYAQDSIPQQNKRNSKNSNVQQFEITNGKNEKKVEKQSRESDDGCCSCFK